MMKMKVRTCRCSDVSFSHESPGKKFKTIKFDFDKLVKDSNARKEMVTGELKVRVTDILDDLEDFGPDKFFEMVHQTQNMMIMKNKFKVVLSQFLNYKHS